VRPVGIGISVCPLVYYRATESKKEPWKGGMWGMMVPEENVKDDRDEFAGDTEHGKSCCREGTACI
jgi:hypothetical protein